MVGDMCKACGIGTVVVKTTLDTNIDACNFCGVVEPKAVAEPEAITTENTFKKRKDK